MLALLLQLILRVEIFVACVEGNIIDVHSLIMKIMSRPQPLGTFHCVTCDQCVKRMDHHCLFTANCVGEGNFPYFFSFVFWAWTATVYAVWLSFHPAGHCEETEEGLQCRGKVKFGLFLASILFCVLLSCFFGFVLILVARGETTRAFLDSNESKMMESFRQGSLLHKFESRLGKWQTWWRYAFPGMLLKVNSSK
eukprot:m.116805 g.116805  ORF g.116805 m.116805 type:complete len:195 (-) comp14241_c0_seq14:19-603(-)